MSDNVTQAPAPNAESTESGGGTGTVGGIGTPAQAKPEAPKTLKIKNAEFKSEDEAWAEIERGRQANKLMAEANRRLAQSSKQEKDWEDLRSEVKTKRDAKKVIERLGLSKEEAVEVFGRWLYNEEVVAREMSPEQRRIRELEAEVNKTKEAREAEERKKAEEAREAAAQQEEVKLREEFTKALQAKRIPPTRLAIRRIANYMAAYAAQGVEVPVDRAIDLVMEDYNTEYGEMFDELDADGIKAKLGHERFMKLAKKISGWALKRAQPQQPQQEVVPKRTEKQEKSDKMTPQEFQAYMRGLR